MEAIKTTKLTKYYGKARGIIDLDLAVEEGEFFGFIGPNGAGKSTTIRTLLGLLNPSSGSAEVLGKSITGRRTEVLKDVGYLPSEAVFYQGMRVKEVLKLSADLRKTDCKAEREKLCERLQLDINKRVEELSFGNRKKVGIVCALQHQPRLLILDEPINGLDPAGIIEIRKLLLKLNQEKNVTILISSHILTELENIATDYGFLNKGKLIEQITAEDLKEKCHSYLEIKVTDAAAYTALLEKEMCCTDYKVLPGGIVHILKHVENVSDYSALAVKHGIGLLSFEMKEINLENYYMSLIGAQDVQ